MQKHRRRVSMGAPRRRQFDRQARELPQAVAEPALEFADNVDRRQRQV